MTREGEFSATGDTSLRAKVFKYVKSQIINGTFRPGEVLLESKLSDDLGVSRTPVREALRLLEVEGLLETTPKKGTVVLGISQKDVGDIYAIRQLVEGLAARWAAEHVSPGDLREMEKTLDLMEFYIQKNDLDEVVALDTKFHQLIYEASASKILNLTLSNLHQYVQLARVESLKVPQRIDHTISEHRAILEAFQRHDPDAAEQAMTQHVKAAYANIVSHYHGEGESDQS